MRQKIIDRLAELVEHEHTSGCDLNTCDIAVAMRDGYALWAIELFAGCGAASEEFDTLYAKLGSQFRAAALKECKDWNPPYVACPNCNSHIRYPDEVDYRCDDCGHQVERPNEEVGE